MNPHAIPTLSPLKSAIQHRNLIWSLIRREVIGRYKGSAMGILWSFFNPILMLAVYTFVFSVVFKTRWTGGTGSKTEFALVLFSGLIVFNLFSECINRAPSLIISNTNYVKKVIFPLEILPIVALGSALFHFTISLLVWIIFYIIFFGIPPVTLIYLPVILIPLLLFVLGLSWFLASLGTYLRDISQVVGIITMILMYLSPIFYPISALPEQYRTFMQINPLTDIIEQIRDVMMWGKIPDGLTLASLFIISLTTALLGFTWFQRTRKGFADVL